MPELSYREAVRDALSTAMRQDDDVFVMGEDIAEMGGSMGVTHGMLEEFEADDREVHEIVEGSVEFAKAGTDPKPEDALKNIYA